MAVDAAAVADDAVDAEVVALADAAADDPDAFCALRILNSALACDARDRMLATQS